MIAVDLVPMLGLLNLMLQLCWREFHRRREERVVLPLNYPLSHSRCNIEALLAMRSGRHQGGLNCIEEKHQTL